MTQKILIVEDEKRLADLLRDYLIQAGFETQWLNDGINVVSCVKENEPDLVVLDLMLPSKDGFEICKSRADLELVLLNIFASIASLVVFE